MDVEVSCEAVDRVPVVENLPLSSQRRTWSNEQLSEGSKSTVVNALLWLVRMGGRPIVGSAAAFFDVE